MGESNLNKDNSYKSVCLEHEVEIHELLELEDKISLVREDVSELKRVSLGYWLSRNYIRAFLILVMIFLVLQKGAEEVWVLFQLLF